MTEEHSMLSDDSIYDQLESKDSPDDYTQKKLLPTVNLLYPKIVLKQITAYDNLKRAHRIGIASKEQEPHSNHFPLLLPLYAPNETLKLPTDIAIHKQQIPLLLQQLSDRAVKVAEGSQINWNNLFLESEKHLTSLKNDQNLTESARLSFSATTLYIEAIRDLINNHNDPYAIELLHTIGQEKNIYYKIPLDFAIHVSRTLAKTDKNPWSKFLPAISFCQKGEEIITSFTARPDDLFCITQREPTEKPRYFEWNKRAQFLFALQNNTRRIPASNTDIVKHFAPSIFWLICLACKVIATFCTTMKFLNLTNNQIISTADHNRYLLISKITIATLDALQTLAARLLKEQANEPLSFVEPPRSFATTDTAVHNPRQSTLTACCNSKDFGLHIFNLGIGFTTIIQTYFNYKYLNLIFSNTPISLLISLGNSPIFIKFRYGKMRYNQLIDFVEQLKRIWISNGLIIFESFNNFFYFSIGTTALTLQSLLTLLNLAITFKSINALNQTMQTITTTVITLLFLVSITMPMVGCSFKRMTHEENKKIDAIGAFSFIILVSSTLAIIYFSGKNEKNSSFCFAFILLSFFGIVISNKTSQTPFVDIKAIKNELTIYFKKKTKSKPNNFYLEIKKSQGKSSIYFRQGKKPRCMSTYNLFIDLLNMIDITISILASTLALLGHKNRADSSGHLALMILISVYASIFSFPAARDNNTYTNHHVQKFLTEIESYLARILHGTSGDNPIQNRSVEIGRRILRSVSQQLYMCNYTPYQIMQALHDKYPVRHLMNGHQDRYVELNESGPDSTDEKFSSKDWPFFVAWILTKHNSVWPCFENQTDTSQVNLTRRFYTGIWANNDFYTRKQVKHQIKCNRLVPLISQACHDQLSRIYNGRSSTGLRSLVSICDSSDEETDTSSQATPGESRII